MGRILAGDTAYGLVTLGPLLPSPTPTHQVRFLQSFILIFFSENHSSTSELLVFSPRLGSLSERYRLGSELAQGWGLPLS